LGFREHSRSRNDKVAEELPPVIGADPPRLLEYNPSSDQLRARCAVTQAFDDPAKRGE
jgi:hypothetical protein